MTSEGALTARIAVLMIILLTTVGCGALPSKLSDTRRVRAAAKRQLRNRRADTK